MIHPISTLQNLHLTLPSWPDEDVGRDCPRFIGGLLAGVEGSREFEVLHIDIYIYIYVYSPVKNNAKVPVNHS